ncbi:uncharacterized protein LOC132986806 [Labrus mixtus]|uniref:uncharacterized protein LOC132986806 n=1 Tax=Labrus mixtus TaxID=508554 RepID=UPI0029C0D262|nr:uncharacterized protein LOC132986806 [Labrus mixtus]
MVIMFHPNQAALLSLLFMHGVFAEEQESNHTDEEVSRGGSVIFTCNTSRETTKQINWSKGRFFFSHSMEVNKTASNLTSDRLTIDLSSKLIISKAQEDDEGLYTCLLTETKGKKIYQWNLTVSDKSEEEKSSGYFLYSLTAGIGVVLCCIISATCLCRKCKAKTADQNPVQDQFHQQSAGEIPQQQSGTGRRTNNKRRSEYMERLNSIYDAY